MTLSKELELFFLVVAIYTVFLKWGYLQEKLVSMKYTRDGNPDLLMSWSHPIALNLCMAVVTIVVAWATELLVYLLYKMPTKPSSIKTTKSPAPFMSYWKASLTNTLASPIGYASLKYISFPLMLLTKSSKPIPVMAIGVFYFGKKYKWYKYVSVGLICTGIALFSSAQSKSENPSSSSLPIFDLSIGIVLVLCNLFMDGYTNNEQDVIFTNFEATTFQFMRNTNIWQTLYLGLILFIAMLVQRENSEFLLAMDMLLHSAQVRRDVLEFCVCGALGQVVVFQIMKDFGSLVWVTVSVTRKLFTILVSVFMFNHKVKAIQWAGVVAVFTGMTIDMYMGSKEKKPEVVKVKNQ